MDERTMAGIILAYIFSIMIFHMPIIKLFEKLNKFNFKDLSVGNIITIIIFLPAILLIIAVELLCLIIIIITNSKIYKKIFDFKPFKK